MNFKKWEPVVYPLALWVLYKIIAFCFGFTGWPDIATLSLLGNNTQPFIVSLAFGIWIGMISHKDFKLAAAVRNAFIVGFLIGFVELSLTIILINSSPSFVAYATSVITGSGRQYGETPFINLVISTWLGGLFTILPASVIGYLFMDREKKGR